MDFLEITNTMNISKIVQINDITNIPTTTAEKKINNVQHSTRNMS
jgi:hypothetical protein